MLAHARFHQEHADLALHLHHLPDQQVAVPQRAPPLANIPRLGLFQVRIVAASAGRPTRLNRSWKRGLLRKASMLGSI
jgi:hypothetical protein